MKNRIGPTSETWGKTIYGLSRLRLDTIDVNFEGSLIEERFNLVYTCGGNGMSLELWKYGRVVNNVSGPGDAKLIEQINNTFFVMPCDDPFFG